MRPARCARARRSRSRRLIWRVKCVGLTDTQQAVAAAGKRTRSLSRPLSFLSENVKGEEASKRTKRRRKEKKRESSVCLSVSLSLGAVFSPLSRHRDDN